MAKLLEGTWVLVADGEKALFLVNDGDADYPILNVRRKEEHENPATRDQGVDKPGRYSDGPAFAARAGAAGHPQRSAFQQTDWHRLEKERFADDLADLLYKRAHAGDFERIILVVPPPILGELRGHLHKEVSDRVVGEITKTLTNHPVDEIERIVAVELAQS